jgi:DMSO/TMAO reductase YedYZ molybdopterin-dependent catalytic subunit
MLNRRSVIAGGVAGAVALPVLADRMMDLALPGGPSARPLLPRFPQKGEMIVQRVHPALLETPFSVFDEGVFTPNDRFFVRWHWDFPASIDARGYRVAIRGAVRSSLTLSLDEVVRSGAHVELAAVNQCAGNGRGLFEPRVAGAQWANGAMGNARWRGVRLRDVLDRAGVNPNARFVRFKGLDTPPVENAPHFMKSLPIDIARADDTIVAFAMNGKALPLLNGYPLRLIVPGWFSTYWVKMLNDIEVLSTEDTNFWMAKAYRMPKVPVKPGDKDFPTVPITTMVPRAFVTSHADGATVKRGAPIELRGIAMGGAAGVAKVDLLVGDAVLPTVLGPDEGKYGFRRWTAKLPGLAQDLQVGARCTNTDGVTQPLMQAWNPSGYARGLVETISLRVA